MTDRPIIFSGSMVRALLAGRKTQTRRLATSPLRHCLPGDRLYVREAFGVASIFTDVVEVRYKASERAGHTEFVEQVPVAIATGAAVTWPRYKPSIHMPRWASRLTLSVEAVRLERLQSISEADTVAEGLVWDSTLQAWNATGEPNWPRRTDPRASFGGLWQSLHDKEGERWSDNPAVVALTFRVARANIDANGAAS
ncbi:hypothetical protein ACFSGX_14085 [Sphingomonas arantia]|uniref:ASCH domain-containing protein n=1 Tax=Sphingomonas arantia TaxID=1460676 RepID=A0ABW4TYT5_9SPHN